MCLASLQRVVFIGVPPWVRTKRNMEAGSHPQPPRKSPTFVLFGFCTNSRKRRHFSGRSPALSLRRGPSRLAQTQKNARSRSPSRPKHIGRLGKFAENTRSAVGPNPQIHHTMNWRTTSGPTFQWLVRVFQVTSQLLSGWYKGFPMYTHTPGPSPAWLDGGRAFRCWRCEGFFWTLRAQERNWGQSCGQNWGHVLFLRRLRS